MIERLTADELRDRVAGRSAPANKLNVSIEITINLGALARSNANPAAIAAIMDGIGRILNAEKV